MPASTSTESFREEKSICGKVGGLFLIKNKTIIGKKNAAFAFTRMGDGTLPQALSFGNKSHFNSCDFEF